MILLRKFLGEYDCQSILMNLPKEVELWEALKKAFLLHIIKRIFGFWVRLLISRKVVLFLYINAVRGMEPHFEKTCICREIKIIIEVNGFSVSCVCFNEIFSVHYGKCIQLTQNETSGKDKNSVSYEYHLRQISFKTRQRQIVLDVYWEVFLQFCLKAIFCF